MNDNSVIGDAEPSFRSFAGHDMPRSGIYYGDGDKPGRPVAVSRIMLASNVLTFVNDGDPVRLSVMRRFWFAAAACHSWPEFGDDGARETWVEIIPGRHWSSWRSCHDSGTHLGGSGVTFTGTLACGRRVARTYDGREWLLAGER